MGGNKAALLIGVSEYSESGLKSLPSATEDIQAMQRVLTRSSEFAADQIRVLANPQKQEVEEAIYWLFADRQKDDLLLFYFSGHGIKDQTGKLYFSLPSTLKDQRGELIDYTAVPATMLHERMNKSRSTCQVLVLDCCFSGAFAKGLTIKDDGSVDIPTNLGGKGRAIFTSSNSIEYSFQQEGLTLSVYTHFFVEGLEKGAADLDGDGLISADELHKYVSAKVKTAAPAMTPQFFVGELGYEIYLGRSVKDDPRLRYRKAVEERVRRGSFQVSKNRFSLPASRALNLLSSQLGLATNLAEEIEAEVLQPLREYQRKLQDYEQTLRDTLLEEEYPFDEIILLDLQDYQNLLGLRDEDVREIEAVVLPEVEGSPDAISSSLPENSTSVIHSGSFLQTFTFEIITVNDRGQETNRRPGQAEFFAEDLGSDITLEMVKIPGGSFKMGSPETEEGRYESESPQHNVTVPSFFMGKFAVTQAQYEAIMGNNPSDFKGKQRPVEQVSWNDAIEFCQKLSDRTNRTYRLPSEAEWEYACRAGTTTPFYFGETITGALANYDASLVYRSEPKGEWRQHTTDVGSFSPNAFGLYDMHGNVWEWCADHGHENYQSAPIDGSAWLTDNQNAERLMRGGSWYFNPANCRSAVRLYYDPGDRYYNLGFRVVCVLA